MKSDKLIRLALTSAIIAALSPAAWAAATGVQANAATAQDAQPAGSAAAQTTAGAQTTAPDRSQRGKQEKTTTLQTLVVTASAVGVRRLDASYNIVTANREEIRQANPVSVADLLKISPGIWPESTGGQTGANIEIAGFPGGGDAPFFTNMINGSPIYGMPSLSFMDSSSLFRLDDTIERVEIVQGGPGAVFGPGQMGATANFILRQGTAEPSGDVGLTYGDEGLWRVDGFYGFKLADGWYASIGGFYRTSDGVRSPQFKADKGGQLTATLSHDWDNGSFMLWARKLNDKNQFMVPIPMIQGSGSSFSGYPGFDPSTGTYGSRAIQHVQVPNPLGYLENANLANGRGGNLNYFGGSFDTSLGSWTISDHFLYFGGDLPTNALFSGPNPRPLGYFLYGCQIAQPAGYCNGATANDTNNLGPNGQGLPPGYDVSATLPNGQTVPLDQSVIGQGWWYIQKRLKSLNNDLRISKEIFSGNTLTAGVYLARYTDHDNWSLGNNMLMLNQPNTQPIGLTYQQNGQTIVVANPQGFYNFNGNYNIVEAGTGTNKAFYLSDSWTIGPWLLQAGGRVENIDVHQRTCNRSPVDLDGNPNTLYDNSTPVCNGTWDMEHYDKTHSSFTAGANYQFNDNMSAYVRANTGGHFNDFDNGIRGANGNFSPMQKIKNMEAGFKFQSQTVFVDVSVYHRLFTGLQYQPTTISGVPTGPVSNYGANTHGLDFNGTWSPIENLHLKLIADYMDGHYSHNDSCLPYTDINGNNQCVGINGKPLQRQPKVRYLFMPSYTLPTGWGSVTGFLTYEYAGQRYEDQTGLQPLGNFHTLGAGIMADYGPNWQFRLQGTNLTNAIGLTEGNARFAGKNAGIGGVILARPLTGREVFFQAKYQF
ncbi:MAG: TonB-dependent receptor plug domain-containing protein [Xanthomonadales bacterium]|nr:TonB-dependent receptor plug domain-containing protein [Xanthomonadales bacterium]ODU93022.1 MAG: TonB-dependent receptor [Rhodanobacter sp. SCN 66-43]OJY83809.1 MAG: TonB-dependent receptor [Xanthomonadales bacterium 66-474]